MLDSTPGWAIEALPLNSSWGGDSSSNSSSLLTRASLSKTWPSSSTGHSCRLVLVHSRALLSTWLGLYALYCPGRRELVVSTDLYVPLHRARTVKVGFHPLSLGSLAFVITRSLWHPLHWSCCTPSFFSQSRFPSRTTLLSSK